MEDQQFCLKWCDHHSNMLNVFGRLLRDGALCDVTLACEGSTLKAHKLVLSASSSFFQDLFSENPCTHPIVILPELKYVDIKALVDFMYNGWVNVMETQLTTLLKAAEILKIKGLGEAHDLHSSTYPLIPDTLGSSSNPSSSKSHSSTLFTENRESLPKNACPQKNEDPYNAPSMPSSTDDRLVDSCKHDVSTGDAASELRVKENDSSFDNVTDIEPDTVPSVMEQTMTTEDVIPGRSLLEKTILTMDIVLIKKITFLDSFLEKNLEKHMIIHKDCDFSDVVSKQEEEIESSSSPIISEKNLVKLPVSCSSCNYTLNTMSDAQSHLSMNPNCRTSQFKCLLCPKLFIWPATLIKHFREQHQGPGGIARVTQRLWYFCDTCKKPLLSKHALFLHRSKFHGIGTDNVSESSENLNMCKRGRKTGTRVCRLCKRTFTSTTEYHSHLQNFHRNKELSSSYAVESASSMNESFSSTENESNSTQSVI
ncbi:zinc finger and BTB domain-containing protein 18.3-like [Uloborus diversus]|uniref:zinc finger and BTB domain-containing protein 18.3-like n=1 Tax=Uloborus diversus TaxID=327109 RepID=UPI002409E4E9|nr:zinc finger and BTB domain-containing protein 18.3-like [Uloborus diversus]